jgi:hypothetical protein
MVQMSKPWTSRRSSDSNFINGTPFVQILTDYAHHADLKWTEDEQAKLSTHVERYTLQGASEACIVHRWWLPWYSLVLAATEDRNHDSGQLYNEWLRNTWGDYLIYQLLRDTFLPMHVNATPEYSEPDEDEASNEALLHEHDRLKCSMPCTPPAYNALLFPPLAVRVLHFKWWLL